MVTRSAIMSWIRLFVLTALCWLMAPGGAQAQTDELSRNNLVVLEERLPKSMHAFELFSQHAGAHLSSLLYERLVHIDPRRNRLVPNLISPLTKRSGRVYVTKIREDVQIRWHDGRPLIPRDIVRSLERLNELANEPDAPQSTQAVANIVLGMRPSDSNRREGGLERVDEGESGELIFTFRRSTSEGEAMQILSLFMLLPSHLTDSELRRMPVGLGPYRLASEYVSGPILLERHDSYFRGTPKIRRIRMEAEPRTEERMRRILEGEAGLAVDLLDSLGKEVLNERTDLVAHPQMSRTYYYLGFNMDTGFSGARFGERPWLREVVTRVVDRDVLLQIFGNDIESGIPLSGPFRPDSENASNKVSVLEANSERVTELFLEEGFDRVGQFYQDSAGTPLEAILAYQESRADMAALAAEIREQLQRYGIAIRLAPRSDRDFEVLLTGEDRRFDLVLHRWSIDEDEDLYDVFHSKGTYNFLHYNSEEVDQSLEQAKRAATPAVRMYYRWRLHEALAEELPCVFLWAPKSVVVLDARIINVPILDPYYVFREVHKWEIIEAQERPNF